MEGTVTMGAIRELVGRHKALCEVWDMLYEFGGSERLKTWCMDEMIRVGVELGEAWDAWRATV